MPAPPRDTTGVRRGTRPGRPRDHAIHPKVTGQSMLPSKFAPFLERCRRKPQVGGEPRSNLPAQDPWPTLLRRGAGQAASRFVGSRTGSTPGWRVADPPDSGRFSEIAPSRGLAVGPQTRRREGANGMLGRTPSPSIRGHAPVMKRAHAARPTPAAWEASSRTRRRVDGRGSPSGRQPARGTRASVGCRRGRRGRRSAGERSDPDSQRPAVGQEAE